MKKIVSLLLVLAMCLAVLPSAVFADGVTQTYTADKIFTENTLADIVSVAAGVNVTVEKNVRLTVEQQLAVSGSLVGKQDASLEIGAGATVTGVTLYNENCTDIWTNFSNREVFVWLENDDESQPIQKWVRFVEGPQGPAENQYCLHYSDMGTVSETASDAIVGFTEDQAITWTLTYPQGITNLYRVEINECVEEGAHFEYNDGDAEHNSDRISVDNTGKTVSFTPNSTNPFEVFIYWTEQDFFNSFGYNPDEEIQLQCRVLNGHVYGTVIEAPMCSIHDDESGWDSVKINVPKDTDSLQVSLVNDEGYEFDKAEFIIPEVQPEAVNGVSENAYTWAAADFGKELNVYFKQLGPSGGDDIEVIFPDDGQVSVSGNVATYSLASKTVTVTVTGANIEYDEEYSARESVTRYHVFVPLNNLDSVSFTFGGDFDPAMNMRVVLNGENNFSAELAVNEGVTTLAHTGQGVHVSGWVFFDIVEDGQQDNPPQEPQDGVDWSALTKALEAYVFAYAGTTSGAIKTNMAKELSERRIGDGNKIGVEAFALGEVLGKNASQLEELITFSDTSSTTNSIISDLPYYTYSLAVEDVDPNTEGNQNFAISGKVYVLGTDRDVIVESEKNGVKQYQIITLSAEEFGTTCEYIDADSIVGVYGNAAMCNGIEGGGEGVFASHVTQEHSGGINTFPIGARLVLTLKEDTVRVVSNYGGDAAPWSFQNVGVYSGVGTESDPVESTVFYGAPSIRLEKATGSKTITDVTVTNLPETAIQYNSGVVNFRTGYDVITLKITYSDDSTGYLTLKRVGLDINSVQVDKEEDVKSSDRFSDEEKAACTGDSFSVWHGTDQSVRYAADKDVYVIGSFYYNDEAVCEGDGKAAQVAQHHSELRSVNLFITIEKTDGTFEYRTVTNAVTLDGTAVNNGGFIADPDNAPGYAGQGGNHFYDDFVLWSGSEADFENIASVSAIAFRAGDAEEFGGVKVGSGAGVEWVRPTR